MSLSRPDPPHKMATGYFVDRAILYVDPRMESFRKIAAINEASRTEWYSSVYQELRDAEANDSKYVYDQIHGGIVASSCEFEDHDVYSQRLGTIFAIYSFIESYVDEICTRTRDWFHLRVSHKDLSGGGLKRCRSYLSKCVGCDEAILRTPFSDIEKLGVLRNALIHTDGRLPEGHSDEKKLRQYSKDFSLVFELTEERKIKLTNLTANFYIEKSEALITCLGQEIPKQIERATAEQYAADHLPARRESDCQ